MVKDELYIQDVLISNLVQLLINELLIKNFHSCTAAYKEVAYKKIFFYFITVNHRIPFIYSISDILTNSFSWCSNNCSSSSGTLRWWSRSFSSFFTIMSCFHGSTDGSCANALTSPSKSFTSKGLNQKNLITLVVLNPDIKISKYP